MARSSRSSEAPTSWCGPITRRVREPGTPIARPQDAAHLGHGREAVVQHGGVAIGLARIAPGDVDAHPPATGRVGPRRVALVIGPGGLAHGYWSWSSAALIAA